MANILEGGVRVGEQLVVGRVVLPQYVGAVVAIAQHGVSPLPLVLDDAVEKDGARHVVVVGQVGVEEDPVVSVADVGRVGPDTQIYPGFALIIGS